MFGSIIGTVPNELAVLSAIEHGKCANVDLAARVASAAIVASADIDAERSGLYLDLILISLSGHGNEAIDWDRRDEL